MFDTVECYSGGILLPEPAPETEAGAERSNGANLGSPTGGSLPAEAQESNTQGPITPERIIQNAYREAERIFQEATHNAEQESNRIISGAKTRADEIAANAVARAANDMGLDLWSSRFALAEIVEKALTAMIGKIGDNEACYRAVELAISENCRDKMVTVSAESRTADRLRLVALSRRGSSPNPVFDITNDDAISPGWCVINAGGQLLEVSLESQISAIREACNQQVAAVGNPEIKQVVVSSKIGEQS